MATSRDLRIRRLSRRAFLGGLALSGAIPILAACGQSPAQQAAPKPAATTAPAPAATTVPAPAATQAPGKPGGPVTIKYMTWWWAEAGRNDAWRALVQKFHGAQNDVRIQEVGFPYSDYLQNVMTQVAGGKLDCDVLSAYDELAIRLLKTNNLEPVDDLVAKTGIKDKLLKAPHDFVTVNGKLYALLMTLTPYALIYNTELYKKEGIAKPPDNRDEYFAVAKQVTHRPNQFGHASRSTMPEQNGWWQDLTQWVLGYDGLWSAPGKKPLVTSDAVINAVKAYKKLYDEAMPQGATASDYRRMAWEGKIVQYIDNSANINILKTGNPDVYPKILTSAPPWPNRKSIAIPNYVGIYAGSQNKDAAKVWWQFVFQKENLQFLFEKALDIIEPYQGVLRPEWVQGLPWVKGFQAANGVVFIATVPGFEANVAEFRQITLQKVSEVLTAGKAPEQAMKEAQADLEALAARIQ
ncbi:MAG: extracellular solute-binding protein [Chloroflexi bacterium]|nr:extracellular solute-binding protein [Chloroflexota bacterium]